VEPDGRVGAACGGREIGPPKSSDVELATRAGDADCVVAGAGGGLPRSSDVEPDRGGPDAALG